MNEILERLQQLEFHQQLLLKMINKKGHEFDFLIIANRLSKKEVQQFYDLCEELSISAKEQEADQFVFYTPLFKEFVHRLNHKLKPEEVIEACLKQNIYKELMLILKKNL